MNFTQETKQKKDFWAFSKVDTSEARYERRRVCPFSCGATSCFLWLNFMRSESLHRQFVLAFWILNHTTSKTVEAVDMASDNPSRHFRATPANDRSASRRKEIE